MDYKSVIAKDGREIIFCKFEDLLTEAFGLATIEEVEATINHSNGEYICHCPFCKATGHRKHKLYVKDDLTVGNCFVCGRAYVNINDTVDTSFAAPSFINDPCYLSQKLELETLHDDPIWNLGMFNSDFTDYSEKGIEYLINRHPFMKELWKTLEFKFWNDNVVIPFKYKSEIFYYQIRFIDIGTHEKGKGIKYYHPKIKKGCKPPYIIESCEHPKKFIICEGVFDAIACLIQSGGLYTPMAVLGSAITDYQISFLREYIPEKILIYMDETSISKRIAAKLKTVIDYCPIKIIPSTGMDPEEMLQKKLKYNKNIIWIND